MSVVGQTAVVAPSARAICWLACGLAVVGLLLPLFATGPQGEWIIPIALTLPAMIFLMMLAAPEAFGVTHRRWTGRTGNAFPAMSVIGLITSVSHDGLINWRLTLLPAGLCAVIFLLVGLA